MLRYLLVLIAGIPICCYCQSYADAPFLKQISVLPPAAHVEGYSHGSIKANDIVIDLSGSASSSDPNSDENINWTLQAHVDGIKPAQTFHFYTQYNDLKAVFGYDLIVKPIERTDKIECRFSVLTDPPFSWWHHDKEWVPVAFPGGSTSIEIKSGDAISITTFPFGKGKTAVVHYLRLSRIDLAASTE
jgi:hypothetical protein